MLHFPVYLDYNATTPLDERVLEAMLPFFRAKFGNAASATHNYGLEAAEAVQTARQQAAALLNAGPEEIIFTSGSTEAINLAIKGVFENYSGKGDHIVTVSTEHKAVLDTCAALEKRGASVTYLPVDRGGMLDLGELEKSITEKTILVCVMYANNETGVVHPVKEISRIVHTRGSIFMTDATQAAGKIPVDVKADGIDLLCFSAHKMYGPKGCGALYVRRKDPRVTLSAQIHGGGHERGFRSGTLNVPGIAGLGKACEIAAAGMAPEAIRLTMLRNRLEEHILQSHKASVNGQESPRLPHVSNVSFHREGKAIPLLSKLAAAHGSACTSASPHSSHVLQAMGVPEQDAGTSMRFSLGRYTTQEEIEFAVNYLKEKLTS